MRPVAIKEENNRLRYIIIGSAIISWNAQSSWLERYDFAVSNHILMEGSVTTARMPVTLSGSRTEICGCRFGKQRYKSLQYGHR